MFPPKVAIRQANFTTDIALLSLLLRGVVSVRENDKTVLLTPEGRQKLAAELEHLRTVRRKEVLEQLAAARQSADGWDSQEFLEAKNEQSFVEGRILTLEKMLAEAEVLGEGRTDGVVGLGSEVVVMNEEGEEERYVIVGSAEADPLKHRISRESPVGKALMGTRAGDRVEFEAPAGKRALTVISVK